MRGTYISLRDIIIVSVIAFLIAGAVLLALQLITDQSLLGEVHGFMVDSSLDGAPSKTPAKDEEPSASALNWLNVYSLASSINGVPVPVGAVVEAFDPDGTLIGSTIVKSSGRYGLMPLYGDNHNTAEDEGAVPGDKIVFTVNGVPAEVSGPDEPIWTVHGDLLEINLIVVN